TIPAASASSSSHRKDRERRVVLASAGPLVPLPESIISGETQEVFQTFSKIIPRDTNRSSIHGSLLLLREKGSSHPSARLSATKDCLPVGLFAGAESRRNPESNEF
ncbi:MAG: hypothetical protein P3W94_009565, partial [Paracoccus sp. (in: a-proteobacteria)]|nr:hypothetical protein [Paracoccus sp. (in: a-proteobacteria)]